MTDASTLTPPAGSGQWICLDAQLLKPRGTRIRVLRAFLCHKNLGGTEPRDGSVNFDLIGAGLASCAGQAIARRPPQPLDTRR